MTGASSGSREASRTLPRERGWTQETKKTMSQPVGWFSVGETKAAGSPAVGTAADGRICTS